MQNNEEIDDNPFRPGSELSREADIIVNLIKEGKPITPTREMVDNGIISATAVNGTNGHNAKISEQAKKNGAKPGVIEVKHSIVERQNLTTTQNEPNNDVEVVIIKKKKKCCDIQWWKLFSLPPPLHFFPPFLSFFYLHQW